jgi:hypothetical protein
LRAFLGACALLSRMIPVWQVLSINLSIEKFFPTYRILDVCLVPFSLSFHAHDLAVPLDYSTVFNYPIWCQLELVLFEILLSLPKSSCLSVTFVRLLQCKACHRSVKYWSVLPLTKLIDKSVSRKNAEISSVVKDKECLEGG